MVAFARAKAQSIFSKLRLTSISKSKIETHKITINEEQFIKREQSLGHFLEAIKRGGIWLS